ncbi:hypothetical protein HUU59_13245 [bacterium]|nr:hypothetical protein [bacterium]
MLLIMLVAGLGIAAEFPHHDHHEDVAHSEMGVTIDGHAHFQLTGVTAHVVHFGPAPAAEFIDYLLKHRFPLPPLFPFERPPKSHLT